MTAPPHSAFLLLLAGCGRIAFDPVGSEGAGDAMDAVTNDAPYSGANRVFLTAGTTTGAMGGIAGADAMCQSEATTAGLSGTFIAFLSTSTQAARDRLAGSRGWVRVDGLPVGDTPAAMFDSLQVFNPINRDAAGNLLASSIAWTGSNFDGTTNAFRCGEWVTGTGSGGLIGFADAADFAGIVSFQSCDALHHVYCFEIGKDVPVAPTPTIGRVAFVSVGTRTVATLAALDSMCAAEAAQNSLTGTFLAAVSTSTTAIKDRYPSSTLPWTRPDGTIIANGDELFTGTTPFPSFAHQTASRLYQRNSFWTGVQTTPAATSATTTNCLDWSSISGSDNGFDGFGHTVNRVGRWRIGSLAPCNIAYRVLCLQQ